MEMMLISLTHTSTALNKRAASATMNSHDARARPNRIGLLNSRNTGPQLKRSRRLHWEKRDFVLKRDMIDSFMKDQTEKKDGTKRRGGHDLRVEG